MKNIGMNRWKAFMRELEMWSIKNMIKKLIGEVDALKFQE